MEKIILASTSEIRKKILQNLKIKFTAISSDFDEELVKKDIKNHNIKYQTEFLANGKALSIAKKYPNHFVIGSDQICELNGDIINKSQNRERAISQLIKLNNQLHIQNNAIVIYHNHRVIFSHYEVAFLQMKNLTKEEIIDYVDHDQSWGSAGSYKFEETGHKLFTKIIGNKNCILGFAINSNINNLINEFIL